MEFLFSVGIDGTVVRAPRVDTTTAQATVSAADGETIVLGGLITEDSEYVHRSVPFLGDIPLIEKLFRFDSFVKKRSELLIILTPRVIRTPEDNERIRELEMARMSWCACDVYKLMDDIGYFPEESFEHVEMGEPDVIYPDLNPTGDLQSVLPPEPLEQVGPTPAMDERTYFEPRPSGRQYVPSPSDAYEAQSPDPASRLQIGGGR